MYVVGVVCVQQVGFPEASLYAAAAAPDEPTFRQHMAVIKASNSRAYKFFMERDPATWARCFMDAPFFGYVSSTPAEVFNSAIKDARGLPIVELVDAVISWARKHQHQNAAEAVKLVKRGNVYPPEADAAIQRMHASTKTIQMYPTDLSESEWRVDDVVTSEAFCVKHDSGKFTCTCHHQSEWSLPCGHVVAVGSRLSDKSQKTKWESKFVPLCLKLQPLVTAYREVRWRLVSILKELPRNEEHSAPAGHDAELGRPQKKRILSRGEALRGKKRKHRPAATSARPQRKRKAPDRLTYARPPARELQHDVAGIVDEEHKYADDHSG